MLINVDHFNISISLIIDTLIFKCIILVKLTDILKQREYMIVRPGINKKKVKIKIKMGIM